MLLLDRYSDWLFERFQGKIKGDFEIDRNELKKVRQLHIIMVSVSAFFGAFFIMLYYLPIHWYGDYFNAHVIHLSLFGFSFDLFWLKQLDSIVLYCLIALTNRLFDSAPWIYT